MKKLFIIGGGFAGLTTLINLTSLKEELEITLYDQRDKFNFLPMLPDIIGRDIDSELLTYDLAALCHRLGVKFVQQKIEYLDIDNNSIHTLEGHLNYDYLVLASGSETNFYGNREIESNSYKLDNVEDTEKLLNALKTKMLDHVVVAGGGYTGIEIATNIKLFFKKHKLATKVTIIEKTPTILGPLPEWMKEYVMANLKRLNIECFLNSSISRVGEGKIELLNGQIFERSMLIWSAGTQVPNFVSCLNLNKDKQGRLKTDQYMRIKDNCFVLGDNLNYQFNNQPLRMAVQFAIAQGIVCAKNIKNLILGQPLKNFAPLDLGYIIPMANNCSCGQVLGIKFKGLIATILHYLMCIYRSYGFKNRLGLIVGLIKGGK